MKKIDYKIILLILMILLQLYFLIFNTNNDKVKNKINFKVMNITVENAYQLYKKNKAIFIDARYGKFYEMERIEGSLSYPYQDFLIWKEKIKLKLKNNRLIIVYCDNKLCSLSYYMAQKLKEIGFNNVYRMLGGIEQWKKKKYPVKKIINHK